MTVCTNYLALRNLVEHVLPASAAKALGDAELFVAKVVELEDDRIALATVHAGVLAEVGKQPVRALGNNAALPPGILVEVALPVRAVVLLLIGRSARPAIRVQLPELLATPREFPLRLLLMAAPASPHARKPTDTNGRSYRQEDPPANPVVRHQERTSPPRSVRMQRPHGEWRSLVAHSAGGRAVAGSNPVSPIPQSRLGRRARRASLAEPPKFASRVSEPDDPRPAPRAIERIACRPRSRPC
jgi:hypothetical protein